MPELLAIAPANGLIVGGPLSPLKGEGPSNCLTIERQEPWTAKNLALAYTGHTMAPLALGAAFLAYREAHDISQQDLGRQISITPGVIHHYESTVRDLASELQAHLEAGRLTFKEARCLADIHDYARQRELAEPFISGRLSSVYVEKVVRRAMTKPDETVDDVINVVLSHAKTVVVQRALPSPPRRLPVNVVLTRIEAESLALAGTLDAVMAVEVPEYRRLKVAQAVRILYTRAHKLLQHWQYTNHNGHGNPPPKHTQDILKATP